MSDEQVVELTEEQKAQVAVKRQVFAFEFAKALATGCPITEDEEEAVALTKGVIRQAFLLADVALANGI